ncbi:hypothetical protein RclHR1_00260023 [Rhizophagus clarus]|nr:hypothetical protein RclHR1_00260023 [Rhizophagus clarus]
MNVAEYRYPHEEIEEPKQKNIEANSQRISNEDTYSEKFDEGENRVKQFEENLEALRTKYQNEHNNYLEICNENIKLKVQLENLSALRAENKKLKSEQKGYSNEINKLRAQLESLSIENENFKKVQTDYKAICNENNNLKTRLKQSDDKLKEKFQKHDPLISDIRVKNSELQNNPYELENVLNNLSINDSEIRQFPNKNEEYVESVKEINQLENLLQKKDKEKQDLIEKKNKLEKEESQLGTITNYRMDEDVLTSKLADSDTKNKILNDNYSTIHNENERLKNQFKELEDKEKSKYDQSTTEKIKNGEIFKFQRKPNELDEVQNKNEEYEKEIKNLNNLLQKREREKQDLIEKNNILKKEASQYHFALGTATNYRMDDDDKNHSVHLKEDIEELQCKLKNYVTTLKGDFEIDFNAVNDLMEKYNIKAKVTPKNPNKPLIRAVLQYHILKKIIKYKDDYFKKNSRTGNEMHLEAEIVSKAKDLEGLLARFSETRDGNDTITQTASIKIRQEVNIALGNRGFSKTLCENNRAMDHVFIILNKNNLNKEINKYRIIKDETKRVYVEKLAPDLIREFVRMVQFRLKVQEPSVQIRWVKVDANIDPSIMERSWDKDDIDNLLVEVCYFPMIGRDLDNEEKRKIYTHAQVFTKRKKFLGNVTNGINFWPKKNKGNLEPVSDDEE